MCQKRSGATFTILSGETATRPSQLLLYTQAYQHPVGQTFMLWQQTSLCWLHRQHIGFVLGALSIFLTWYTWEENNPNSVWRALACLCLCLVGLGFHELRPFQVSMPACVNVTELCAACDDKLGSSTPAYHA